jgi:hypothetical protein
MRVCGELRVSCRHGLPALPSDARSIRGDAAGVAARVRNRQGVAVDAGHRSAALGGDGGVTAFDPKRQSRVVAKGLANRPSVVVRRCVPNCPDDGRACQARASSMTCLS